MNEERIDFKIKKIIQAFPDLKFKNGNKFSFHPPRTITIGPTEHYSPLLLCHEIGHALSGKFNFTTDIERLKIERLAWEEARKLCQRFEIFYDEDFIEEQLDSYRDWLHQKSKCKKCGLTRYQTTDGKYHCPNCDHLA